MLCNIFKEHVLQVLFKHRLPFMGLATSSLRAWVCHWCTIAIHDVYSHLFLFIEIIIIFNTWTQQTLHNTNRYTCSVAYTLWCLTTWPHMRTRLSGFLTWAMPRHYTSNTFTLWSALQYLQHQAGIHRHCAFSSADCLRRTYAGRGWRGQGGEWTCTDSKH